MSTGCTREMDAETWVRAPRDPAAFKVRLESEDNGRRLIAAVRGVSVPGRAGRRVARLARRRPRGADRAERVRQVDAPARAGGRAGPAPRCTGSCGCFRRRRSGSRTWGLLEWFRSETSLPEAEARTLLAHYRLGADAIDRPLTRLSPGERARVHVAAIVGAGADLILLDEPTNHLDFDTLEVIEAALRAYRGTLVVATHDRALIDAIECDQVLEVRDRGLVVSSNASASSS